MYLPAGASFFSAGLPKSPPSVELLVAVEGPAAVLSFFSPSFRGPNRLVVVTGAVSFFSSGFAASLFVPNSPPPIVPPVPGKARPPVVEGTAVDVPEFSGFLAPNKPPLNPEVVVEVEVGVAILSAGLGGSPKIPPVAGVVAVVEESPAGLDIPNSPLDVVFVNRLPEVATNAVNTNRKSEC